MTAMIALLLATPATAQEINRDPPVLVPTDAAQDIPPPIVRGEPIPDEGGGPIDANTVVDAPEPATWILAATGASAVALWRRKNKKSA